MTSRLKRIYRLHPLGSGLTVVMDVYNRKVLSRLISNSIDATVGVDCLEGPFRTYCKPELFNSDQGSPFNRTDHTSALKREELRIIMAEGVCKTGTRSCFHTFAPKPREVRLWTQFTI